MTTYPFLAAVFFQREIAGMKRRPEVDNVLIERLA
jgi:hypothetical protein